MSKYAPYSARAEREKTVRRMEKMKEDPATFARVENKQKFNQLLDGEKKELAQITPPPVDDAERAKIEARANFLGEVMREGDPNLGLDPMNSIREQKENPAGAAAALTRWHKWTAKYTVDNDGTVRLADKKKGEQGIVQEWKDLNYRLAAGEGEEEYPDAGNVERLRKPDKRGESRLINYRRASFAQGTRLTTVQYNERVGHEPSAYERGIMDAEATAVPPSPEQIYAGAARTCSAFTKSGARCKRKPVAGSPFCSLTAHQGS